MTIHPPPARVHYFKVHHEHYAALESEAKKCEIRRDDRQWRPRVGDLIVLKCWDPDLQNFSGHELKRRVTHIVEGGGTLGLLDADVYVMSLEPA